jgi:hypothetical protein
MDFYSPVFLPAGNSADWRSIGLGQNADTGRQIWVRATILFFAAKLRQAEFVKNFTSSFFRPKNTPALADAR